MANSIQVNSSTPIYDSFCPLIPFAMDKTSATVMQLGSSFNLYFTACVLRKITGKTI